MSHYTLTGVILKIDDPQTFPSGFTKREFVVETSADKYPQQIKLEVTKERCASLDQMEVGDPVQVEFDVRGNEYNGKHYVSLTAWRVTVAREGAQQAQPQQAKPTQAKPAPQTQDDDTDEIPF
jgi:hypothetical protein